MAFATHTDHWALGTASSGALVIKDSGLPKKIPVNASAKDATGNVVARATAGDDRAPANSFAVKTDIADVAAFLILGTIAGTTPPLMLTELNITAGAEQEPTFSVAGVSVETGATTGRTVTLPTLALSADTIAQILGAAFTLEGDGCHVNKVEYSAKISPVLVKPNGVVVAHGFGGCLVEVKATIIQSGSTVPTVTAATGYKITDGPSPLNPESEYDTWTVTLQLDVDGTAAA